MSGTGPLILLIEPQLDFVDRARSLLNGARTVSAWSMAEGVEIAEGGRVDLAILGPSFGNEAGVNSAGALLNADPSMSVVLVAHVLTNRVLKAALRMGFQDVVEAPLTPPKIQAMIEGHRTEKVLAVVFTEPTPSFQGATPTTGTAGDGSVLTLGFSGGDDGSLITHHQPIPADTPTTVILSGPAFESTTVTGTEAAPQDAPVATFPTPEPPIRPETPVPEPQPTVPQAPEPQPTVPQAPAPPPTPPPMAALPEATATPPLPSPPPDLPSGSGVVPPPGMPPAPQRDLLAEIDGPDDEPPTEVVGFRRPSRPAVRGRSVGSGTVITVMAGKGGSGKTVAATNLAMSLTDALGEDRVVVLDADLQFGDVALLLQLDPSRTIVNASEAIDDLTEPRLDGLLLRHESGLRVLAAPLAPSSSEKVTPKTVVRLMDMLQGMYEFVIVDTAPIFDDALMTILEHSDEVVLVVDMDLPSVKNAKIALDTLRASGYPMGRVHLLVNRVNSKARLDLVELERALGMEVAASVPSDRLVPQSVNEGVPAVAMSPRSKVAKAFEALADLFLP